MTNINISSARDFIDLTKPKITLMTILVAGGGMMLAPAKLSLIAALSSLCGIGLLVSGSSVLNMYLERDHDRLMMRTKFRPLPEGRVSPNAALIFGLGLSALAILPLILVTNITTVVLGIFSLVAYVAIYTPMKRVSAWSLVVGAIPGAMPALLGYTAACGAVDKPAIALFGIAFLWQLPHFIAISIFRGEDYYGAGFPVVAKISGIKNARTLINITSALLILNSLALVWLDVGGMFYAFCCVALGAWFFGACMLGYWADDLYKWGRKIFKDTLIYQTILYAALAIDVAVKSL